MDMDKRQLSFIALLVVPFIIAACRGDVDEPHAGDRARVLEAPPQPLKVEGAADEPGLTDPRLRPSVQVAKQDLSAKVNAKPETIEVVEARYVTWPDSSLGCPKPDMAYMQVLTDGVLIVLRHGGAAYHYHGSREGSPFYCARPREPAASEPREATR